MTMITLLAGFTQMTYAQDTPSKVTDAFNSKFPNAKSIRWDKENETEWEAEFTINGVEYSANFSKDGAWKETEHEVKIDELPAEVISTLKTQFAGYEIKEVEMVETPTFTGYEVELKKGKETLEVLMDKAGKVIKKKVEMEED